MIYCEAVVHSAFSLSCNVLLASIISHTHTEPVDGQLSVAVSRQRLPRPCQGFSFGAKSIADFVMLQLASQISSFHSVALPFAVGMIIAFVCTLGLDEHHFSIGLSLLSSNWAALLTKAYNAIGRVRSHLFPRKEKIIQIICPFCLAQTPVLILILPQLVPPLLLQCRLSRSVELTTSSTGAIVCRKS